MIKVYMALWYLLNLSTKIAAQPSTFDIQEITIQDTFLRKQIGVFVDELIREGEQFHPVNENFREGLGYKGLGYIRVEEKSCYQNDTLRSYYLSSSYFDLDEDSSEPEFPVCYAWIKGRLVFFESDIVDSRLVKYSKKSKRRLRKKLEPFLFPAEYLFAKDEQGNVIFDDPTFRPDQVVPLDGEGKLIYIFRNRPPEVKRSAYH